MELKKIDLPFRVKSTILALGAQTKNTVCFAKGNSAYLSQVHKDLNDPKDFLQFDALVKFLLRKNPKIIAYDLHPEYQSTKFALGLSPKTYHLRPIQHHHSHIASCMLENGLANQKVIGVAFDGTGLGTDNQIWGAEFLVCDYKNFTRSCQLREIPLLGGEKAILEPWRLAASWLYLIYKDAFLNFKIDFVKGIDKSKWLVLKKMYLSGFNSPLASSMGRLFDAAASLVLAKFKANFEAELAIEFEKQASNFSLSVSSYKFNLNKNKNLYILNPAPLFKELISDLKHKEPQEKISSAFHLSIAQMINKTCLKLRDDTNINQVILSGGVFQNKLLLNLALRLLYKQKFKVFTHRVLPCNDSNTSLGQIAIANF